MVIYTLLSDRSLLMSISRGCLYSQGMFAWSGGVCMVRRCLHGQGMFAWSGGVCNGLFDSRHGESYFDFRHVPSCSFL